MSNKALIFEIIIGILVLLLFGCRNEDIHPCSLPIDGDTLKLSDSALTFVSNYEDANRVIFKTRTGDEFPFTVTSDTNFVIYQVGHPCTVDTLRTQITKGTAEKLTYTLINKEVMHTPLFINALVFPENSNRPSEESIFVTIGDLFTNPIDQEDVLFGYNLTSTNNEVKFLDSFLIDGKTFYSVYEADITAFTPQFAIKYNTDQGIVYIKDEQSTVEYIYERKE